MAGQCTCVPECDGKECGDDGCDGNCGQCPGPQDACIAGECQLCADVLLCQDKECGPAGLNGECDCGTCPDGHACAEGGVCCTLGADVWDLYQALLWHPSIVQALSLTPEQYKALLEAINELECGAVAHWDEFESTEIPALSFSQVEKVWLRRVAHAMFMDVHQEYPWRLTDYTDDELTALLGLHIQSYQANTKDVIDPDNFGTDLITCQDDIHYTFYGELWCANPLTMKAFTSNLFAGLVFQDADDASHAVFEFIHYLNSNFEHYMGIDAELWDSFPKHAGCGQLPNWNVSMFLTILRTKNDRQVGALIREAMRSCNIPTVTGDGWSAGVNQLPDTSWTVSKEPGGILFPSVAQVLAHGDDVYGAIFPPEVKLITHADYLYWDAELAPDINYSEVCNAELAWKTWKYKRMIIGLFERYQEAKWWPLAKKAALQIAAGTTSGSLEAMMIPSTCWGAYQTDLGDDPDIELWVDCLVHIVSTYGDDGNLLYKCPQSCLCADPACYC